MTLTEFLAARLSDDQAAAEAATPGEWYVMNSGHGDEWYVCSRILGQVSTSLGRDLNDEIQMIERDGDHGRGDAAHIARHDPARVLREVEAKRKILAEIWQYEAKIDGEWGDCHDAEAIAAGECPEIDPNSIAAVRALAAIWRDHPDYDPAWA